MAAVTGSSTKTEDSRPPERASTGPSEGNLVRALVGLSLVAGAALRVWILLSPLGALDSDEALAGIMARHALKGELTAFYWGQTYNGTHEVLMAAPLQALFPYSTVALKVVPIFLSALAAFLVWRVGRWTVGEPFARLGAALFWVWPSFLVWWSTKERLYWVGVVIALALMLLSINLAERVTTLRVVAWGLLAGLGWWATPQILYLLIPAANWTLIRSRATHKGFKPRHFLIASVPAVIGALPWIVFNLRTRGGSFVIPPQPTPNNFPVRLGGFFREALPSALSLKVPFTGEWIPTIVGPIFYALAIAGFAWVLIQRPKGTQLLLAVAVLYPVLFALSPFAWYVADPRYLLYLSPVLSLLLARALATRWAQVLGVIAAIVLSSAGLVAMQRSGSTAPRTASGIAVPANFTELIAALDQTRPQVRAVRADYWIAYRITFESNERIIASPFFSARYEPYERFVNDSGNPVAVFIRGSKDEEIHEANLKAARAEYRRITTEDFAVFLLEVPGSISN